MNAGRVVFSVVMGLVGFMGSGALVNGIRLLLVGDPNRAGAIAAVIIGLVLVGLAAWYFYWSAVREPLEAARLDRARKLYPGQPWMERADWASRTLKSSAAGTAALMWVWTVGWWFFLAVIGTVNHAKIMTALHDSWGNAALLALFVGAGLIGLWLALKFTLTARRYGVSTLVLDTLPGRMGERFQGTLTARLSPVPRHLLSVELACEGVEWVTTGYGDKRRTRLVVTPLGKATASADARTFMPTSAGLRGRIEVDVPGGLHSSSRDAQGNGIRWNLRIATTGDDAPFSCEFEIPVFERSV